MQPIIVEKPYEFVPPMRTTIWSTFYRLTRLHAWYLARYEKVTSAEVRGLDHFLQSFRAGHGILLTPNHCRTADPIAVSWIAYHARCHFYAMASWHLFQDRFQRMMIRSMGGFSVNREAVDRAAVNLSVDILSNAERPLVIFPEGVTSRTNDRLGALLDGVAFVARTAAKRRAKAVAGGKVVIHPVGIKYLFQGDVEDAIDSTLSKIEQRFTWPPQRQLPLVDRIVKVGLGILALKEVEFFGAPQTGPLMERRQGLIERLLAPNEEAWLGKVQAGPVVPRVKALRMKLLPPMLENGLDAAERARRWRVLSELYLAQQLDSYPPDYLAADPTVDRMLEIVEKFEEDLTDVARPHAPTKVVVEIGEAIEVSPERERGAAVDPLLALLAERLQGMLDRLAAESPRYTPQRLPAE